MKPIKKILVPTDFSENAIQAYTRAQEIADRFGAKIDFIHVIPTLKYFSDSISELGAPLDMSGDIYPTVQKEAKHRMEELMKDYLTDQHIGKAISQIDRKPSTHIAKYAEAEGYDLIVMACKGKHESNLLRGSTTEKVIRHSTVPVFTVDARLSSEGLKRILLPTDGSNTSFAALPMALNLADIYDAEITLYHAQELYGGPLDNISRDPNKSDEVNTYEAIIDRLEDFLIEEKMENVQLARGEVNFEDQFILTEDASSRSINFYTVIEKSVSAHSGIEAYAADHADVVVMATHGHSGLAHFFLGSTTEKVAQYLDIPVLTVKPGKDKLEQK